jgi:dolichol kinase
VNLASESRRKAIHFAAILIPIGYLLVPPRVGRLALFLATVAFLVVDMLRLHEPHVRGYFSRFLGSILRSHERTQLMGGTYLLLSTLICVFAFSRPIAVAAVSFLIVGDTVAAIVGKGIGRIRIFGKTLEGSLACFASCLAVGSLVPGLSWPVTLVGSLVATVFELLPVPLDDNFRLPLFAGFSMQLLSWYGA